MALKPITLRLDEDEYERLKELLGRFGDPDINVAYVVRAYIRDLNRALPLIVQSDVDLKNYFSIFGLWLKHFVSMTDVERLTKGMTSWWPYWNPAGAAPEGRSGSSAPQGKKHRSAFHKKRGGETGGGE